MPYVDESYYYDEFQGESVDDADFLSLAVRAGEIIEELVRYRFNEDTFETMPNAIQNRIKKAICAQIEYLDANGGSEMDNGSDLQSAGLGKFNYMKSSSGNSQSVYAPRAVRILAPTGLLYRGGGT